MLRIIAKSKVFSCDTQIHEDDAVEFLQSIKEYVNPTKFSMPNFNDNLFGIEDAVQEVVIKRKIGELNLDKIEKDHLKVSITHI